MGFDEMRNNIALVHDPESNEVAQELSLVQLSVRALASGIPMGFNCAEVIHFINTETFEDCLEVIWGDQKVMRLPRMRIPQSYAMSYSEEDPCTRAPRQLLMTRSALSLSCDELDRQFTAHLLEIAQDSCRPPRADRQEIA